MKVGWTFPTLFAIVLLFCDSGCAQKSVLHIGLIHDGLIEVGGWNLSEIFPYFGLKMQQALCATVSAELCQQMPSYRFTVGEFSTNEVCRQIGLGARVIISLTTCPTSRSIEDMCSRYKIPHFAVPKPACKTDSSSQAPYPQKNLDTGNWSGELPIIQLDPKLLATALMKIWRAERATRIMMISDGVSVTPFEFLRNEFESTLVGKLTAQISTHLFHLGQPAGCVLNGNPVECHGFNLDHLLNSMANFSEEECHEKLPQLAILFTLRENVAEVMNKVIKSEQKGCHLYWVIADQSDVELEQLLQLLNTIDHRKTNLAVIRQVPLNFLPKLSKITADSHKYIDSDLVWINATGYPERIFVAINVIFEITQAYIDALQTYPEHILTRPLACTTINPEVFIAGEKIRQDTQNFIKLSELNDRLLFYATDTTHSETRSLTEFQMTATYDRFGLNLTGLGKVILAETGYSGLFPNRFRGLFDQPLRVGVVIEPPFINDAVVAADGKLSNTTGMIVDVVELLAERFHFKPIYVRSRDGKFGDMDKDGNWTGLIRDLLDNQLTGTGGTIKSFRFHEAPDSFKHIDIAAGPISFNERRSKVVHQLGPFMYLSTALAAAKSSSDNSMFKMLRPFHHSTWIAVTLTILIGGSLMFILNKYSPFCAYNLQLPGASPDEVSFPQNLWSSLSRFLLQGCDVYPLAFSARSLFILFCFTTVVLHVTWQADMTAFMTRKWIPPPITSLYELAYSGNYQPFAIPGSSIVADFATAKENPVSQAIYQKLLNNRHSVQSTADAISLLLNDPTMVFIHDRHLLEYYFNRNCNAIQILPVHFGQTPSGFAVTPGHEFEQPFTDYLIRLYETGSIDRLFKKWWFASEVCSTNEAHYQPMALTDLMGAFIILMVAVAISFLVLVTEFGYFHCLRQLVFNRKHRRVADNTANSEESTERRRSAMMLSILPESTANALRYAGRRRISRAYNASVIDLQSGNQQSFGDLPNARQNVANH